MPTFRSIAWPNGLQEELSEPVAVLLGESAETLSSWEGFRAPGEDFRKYVLKEIVKEEEG
ncbi:MAG: hypothetical protein IPH16_06110 [Haliscomenobacter sp.]|nr:hypothetical protein [Haliscomenobacter sp.]